MFRRVRPLIIACLVLVNAIVFFWIAARTLPFPYGMDCGEGILLDQAVRIAASEELYRTTWASPPYINANYPPLYPLLIAGIGAVTGWPLLLIGRSLSLVASLVGGWAIWMLARQWLGSKLAGWLAIILIVGNPLMAMWVLMARVDALALALNLLALWLLIAHWRSWFGLTAQSSAPPRPFSRARPRS